MTIKELEQIAAEREEWAEQAHNHDLHGTAKEWELTARIARELIDAKRDLNGDDYYRCAC